MKQLSPTLVVVAILCSGCPGPLPDRSLNQYVQEQDVIGVWRLAPESLALLTRDGFQTDSSHQYSIQFKTNGVCSFQSVVVFRSGTYYNVDGTWKLEYDTMGNSNVKKKNAISMELALPTGRFLDYLNFGKEDENLVLWNFYSDPDSWEFMEYRKAEPSP